MKHVINIFLVSVASLAFYGCITPPKIDLFYLNDGIVQYFVRMADFQAEDPKGKLASRVEMDFTVREIQGKISQVVCNFTIIGSIFEIAPITRAWFEVDDETEIEFQAMHILFTDRLQKAIRYSCTVDVEGFKKFLLASKVTFSAAGDRGTIAFEQSDYMKIQRKAARDSFAN